MDLEEEKVNAEQEKRERMLTIPVLEWKCVNANFTRIEIQRRTEESKLIAPLSRI